MRLPWPFILSGAALASCGGMLGNTDAGPDAQVDVDAGDAGWSQCTAPEGYAVCGGPNQCSPGPQCYCDFGEPPGELGVCVGNGYPDPLSGIGCYPGFDGRVCIHVPQGVWGDAPFDVGVLFAQNGAAARVRYADLSLWTGDPLPQATTCPSLGNVLPCGGSCGACPSGEACVGRSPIHPVGICNPDKHGCSVVPLVDGGVTVPCPDYTTQSCFTFVVQSGAQPEADMAGICLPKADCDALAQALPGGGKCYGGP